MASLGQPMTFERIAGAADQRLENVPALKKLEWIFGKQNIIQRYTGNTGNTGIVTALNQPMGVGAIGCYFAAQDEGLECLIPNLLIMPSIPEW